MPADGMSWIPKPEILTDDEVVRLVRIGVEQLGITQVRLTGGEPLLRPGLVDIVSRISALTPAPAVSLTSNGIGLDKLAAPLAAAGLNRVNISLDTLDRQTFVQLAKRDRLDDVLAGLAAASAAGMHPVKVNAVLLRGINDHDAPDLLAFCLEHGYQLRFIEQMPLDPMHGWTRDRMITAEEIMSWLESKWQLSPDPQERGSAPAQTWLIDDGPARVGIIASITQPFCGDCDRVRLTADGQVRNCLFARRESDLRSLLRGGASDAELAEAWCHAMLSKAAGHGVDDPSFRAPDRPMSAIGG